MTTQTAATRPARPAASPTADDRRGVRLPQGADSQLFGGWGVRF